MVMKRIMVKCADISNPCRPLKLSKVWTGKIAEEYFSQVCVCVCVCVDVDGYVGVVGWMDVDGWVGVCLCMHVCYCTLVE